MAPADAAQDPGPPESPPEGQAPEVRPAPARRGQGYPRHLRLVRQRDFDRVFGEGSRARTTHFTIAVVPNGLGHSRLGLSIGKRVWKGAVRRNRVRRIARESFRLAYDELPPGIDLVFIGSVPRIRPELEQTRAELVKAAHKAHARYEQKVAARQADEEAAPGGPAPAPETPAP